MCMHMTRAEAGTEAEFVSARKVSKSKYQNIAARYDFIPLAFDSNGSSDV